MRFLPLILVATLCTVPLAGAQQLGGQPGVTIKAVAPPHPVMPEIEVLEVPVDVSVACTLDDLRGEPTRVTLRFSQVPPYAHAVIEPASHTRTFSVQQCQTTSPQHQYFRSHVRISFSRDAPAFMDGLFEILATAQKPGGATGQAKSAFTVKAGYVPALRVEAPLLHQDAAPGQRLEFPLQIENLGNGPTRVRIDIVEADDAFPGVRPGPERILESRAFEGASAAYRGGTMIETVAPDRAGSYLFQARILGEYAGPGAWNSEETLVAFAVTVLRDAPTEDPASDQEVEPLGTASAAGLPLLALCLLGAALWRRRL